MAELAVQAAITIIDTVVNYLISANYERKERHDFDSTKKWLQTAQSYLKDTEGIKEVTEGFKDRVKQVRDVACEIEDAMEEFMLQLPQHFHEHKITQFLHDASHWVKEKIPLHGLNTRMETIKARIEEIDKLDRIRVLPPVQATSFGGREPSPVCYPAIMDEELVGIERRRAELLDLILNGESRMMVISVAGSRGSGKTTLIKEVYKTLKDDFDFHAWIPLPHPVADIADKICAAMELPVPQGKDAKQKLRSHLQQKRYLVVLDGIWDKNEWNIIDNVLPTGSFRSIIIVSTHIHDVVSYNACHCYATYQVEPLTWNEAWGLFCKKTFRDTKCPQHLIDCSVRIVKRCEGSPLAIVDIASLLSNKLPITSEFEKFHDSIGHELGRNDHPSIMGRLLRQTYHHLPHHLKRCLLYFCNFPEDYSVRRGRLVRLWVAERFVVGAEGGHDIMLEDRANEYLNDLIQMNLVHVSRRDVQGRVKSCRVLNLVREFILSKSEDENFCVVFNGKNKSLVKQPRRLSLHSSGNNTLPKTDSSGVRTLMTFGRDSCAELLAEKPLKDFRLLRVLDLEGATNLDSFPEKVVHLTLLRYLSLRNTKIKTVPRAVQKLQSLVALDLRQTCIERLPKGIRKLHNLLYLLVDRMDENQARVGVELPPRIKNLTSLRELSLVKANINNHRTVRELEKLVELRKLGITDLARENGMDLCASVQKMKHLTSLYVTSGTEEPLDLNGIGKPPPLLCSLYLGGRLLNTPQWISSLHSLAKVSLIGSKLVRDPLGPVKALPSLLELKLVDAYVGELLEFEAKCFQKLVILEIEQFNELRSVVVGKGALPELKKLTLRRCEKLNKAPSGIHRLVKLEEILLDDKPFHHKMHETFANNRAHHYIPVTCPFKYST